MFPGRRKFGAKRSLPGIWEAYLAQLHAEQPVPTKTRKRKAKNMAAQAYLARQTLDALESILSPGIVDGRSFPALNLAFANLTELKLAAEDILLQRSGRHELPLFKELRLFASQGTCTLSPEFLSWRNRFDLWQLESAREYGICRVPTVTDFLRQGMEEDDKAWPHPFFSCPTALGNAHNIWVLPAAPKWWHDALWKLGPGPPSTVGPEGDLEDADPLQGDVRWRLYRAAGELKSITGCSIMLVPPPIGTPPPDFVHSTLCLSSYIKIIGDVSLDRFARCHCTQELLRMQLDEMPVTSPYQRHGNWENADGLRFFCQWVDACPPCEDALRGAFLCSLDEDDVDYDFQEFCEDDYG